ncbi:MAG: IPT/TIG domain-containing protein [Spirochaetaceae bacterium]|jgi:transglutaminase-like putative cysteine protease|nr:IPT/TIG domain-containing protein [Spirochaetaceae bacterium]
MAVAATVLLAACTDNRPRITGITPKFGSEGDIITISGEHFGEAGNWAYITIAGDRPTASSYTLWRDDMIKLQIPRHEMAGLVYVFTDGKQSNGVLFSDRDAIPQKPAAAGGKTGPMPVIDAINPKTVSPGDLLTITGSGFGASRETSKILFTWDLTGRPERLDLPASPFEGGYERWGEREIRVYVPDGTGTGLLTVSATGQNDETEESARPALPGSQIPIEVSRAKGKKTLGEGREYIVAFSTDVMVQEAAAPNALYLAIPRPTASASQQITRVLSKTPKPFTEDYRGTTLYKLTDMRPGETMRVSVNYLVSVYTVETAVTQTALTQDTRLPVYKAYLGKTPLVPADHNEITEKAAAIVGRERNPYLKARLIYRSLLKDLAITDVGTDTGDDGGTHETAALDKSNAASESPPESASGSALHALRTQTADSYSASLLFSALCRAAGIPAVPCAGVLVNTDRSTVKHYWAAFWLDGVGWIPVDVAFGLGAAPDTWTLRPDYASWYFGNIDNQRIAFSFGETALPPIDPKGRTVSRDRAYALQNIWEEAVGGIESYSSFWSDITINGIYYH